MSNSNKNTPPLSEWNEGQARNRILDFVAMVTDPEQATFVPEPERIAAFDMDGTLMCSQPLFFNLEIAVEYLKEEARKDESLRKVQPYQAAWEGDLARLFSNYYEAMAEAYKGKTPEYFKRELETFLTSRKHPKFGILHRDMIWKPMLQLITYLQENQFMVYIVTGSDQTLVRTVCELHPLLKKCRPVGSRIDLDVEFSDKSARYYRKNKFLPPLNEYEGKLINLQHESGQRPIFAFGDGPTDFAMLRGATREKPGLGLLLLHDDAERAYDYPAIGVKNEWRKTIQEEDWVPVSLKNDFRSLF